MWIHFSAGGRRSRSNDCIGRQDRRFLLPPVVKYGCRAVPSKVRLHPKGPEKRVPTPRRKNDSSRRGGDAGGRRDQPQQPPPSSAHPGDMCAWKPRLTVRLWGGLAFLPRAVRNKKTRRPRASARSFPPRPCSLILLATVPGSTLLLPMSLRRRRTASSSGRDAETAPVPRRTGFRNREFSPS